MPPAVEMAKLLAKSMFHCSHHLISIGWRKEIGQKYEERICVSSCWKAWCTRLIWAEEVQLHVASKLEQNVPCFLSYSGVHHEGFCASVHLLCMFISSTGSCSYSYEWAVLESIIVQPLLLVPT